MSTADLLHELAEKVDRFESARRCLESAEAELRQALGAAGPVGQALAPLYFERSPEPHRGLAPDAAPTWITAEITREQDQERRFDAFVASIDLGEVPFSVDQIPVAIDEPASDVDVLADPVVAEALAQTAELVAVDPPRPDPEPDASTFSTSHEAAKANDPELPDGCNLDEPITLNQFAKLLGLNPATVYEAEKLAALPPKSLVRVPELLKPKVIPRIALKGWRPTPIEARIRELLGETA